MDRQTTDKVIPMCRYASQATQKLYCPILLLINQTYCSQHCRFCTCNDISAKLKVPSRRHTIHLQLTRPVERRTPLLSSSCRKLLALLIVMELPKPVVPNRRYRYPWSQFSFVSIWNATFAKLYNCFLLCPNDLCNWSKNTCSVNWLLLVMYQLSPFS